MRLQTKTDEEQAVVYKNRLASIHSEYEGVIENIYDNSWLVAM
tara:strand:- start:246 stop:374 length:129 start_codon:yes stop_codon:yes gene_type:complete